MSRYFKKPNLFTPLIVVAAVALAFRAVNIVTSGNAPDSGAGVVMQASATPTPHESKEEPPPISQAELENAVKATAAAADAGKADASAEVKKDAPPSASPGKSPVDPSPAFTASEIEVLQSLAKRRDELDAREKVLGQREALLKAAGQEVDRKVAELTRLKADMEKLLGQQQKDEEDRILSLVKIYENMKPLDAANIFNKLDMDILLDVIGRMNARKVSPILAGMDSDKAKEVTIRLAEQRRLPVAGKQEAEGKPSP